MSDKTQQILNTELKQPAIDLISHIEKEDVDNILVVGGIEQDIHLFKARWPDATVVFVAAQEISKEIPSLGQFDLVFSNAAIQYLPNHTQLITSIFQLLNKDGILAVQVPNALNMPIQVMMESIARDKKWRDFLKDIYINYFVPKYYYEVLSKLTSEILLWETNYNRIFFHYQEIVNLYAETEMKEYLQRIPDEDKRTAFTELLLDMLPADYKKQSNEAILFPYRRTFFIAKNINY